MFSGNSQDLFFRRFSCFTFLPWNNCSQNLLLTTSRPINELLILKGWKDGEYLLCSSVECGGFDLVWFRVPGSDTTTLTRSGGTGTCSTSQNFRRLSEQVQGWFFIYIQMDKYKVWRWFMMCTEYRAIRYMRLTFFLLFLETNVKMTLTF